MKLKAELEMLRHTNKVQADNLARQSVYTDRMLTALTRIRSACRNETMPPASRILDIYCLAVNAVTFSECTPSGSKP